MHADIKDWACSAYHGSSIGDDVTCPLTGFQRAQLSRLRFPCRSAQKHGDKHSKHKRQKKARRRERERSSPSSDAAHMRRRDRRSRSPSRPDASGQERDWSDKRRKRELWDSPEKSRRASPSVPLLSASHPACLQPCTHAPVFNIISRQFIARGHRADTWESGSLNHGV